MSLNEIKNKFINRCLIDYQTDKQYMNYSGVNTDIKDLTEDEILIFTNSFENRFKTLIIDLLELYSIRSYLKNNFRNTCGHQLNIRDYNVIKTLIDEPDEEFITRGNSYSYIMYLNQENLNTIFYLVNYVTKKLKKLIFNLNEKYQNIHQDFYFDIKNYFSLIDPLYLITRPTVGFLKTVRYYSLNPYTTEVQDFIRTEVDYNEVRHGSTINETFWVKHNMIRNRVKNISKITIQRNNLIEYNNLKNNLKKLIDYYFKNYNNVADYVMSKFDRNENISIKLKLSRNYKIIRKDFTIYDYINFISSKNLNILDNLDEKLLYVFYPLPEFFIKDNVNNIRVIQNSYESHISFELENNYEVRKLFGNKINAIMIKHEKKINANIIKSGIMNYFIFSKCETRKSSYFDHIHTSFFLRVEDSKLYKKYLITKNPQCLEILFKTILSTQNHNSLLKVIYRSFEKSFNEIINKELKNQNNDDNVSKIKKIFRPVVAD